MSDNLPLPAIPKTAEGLRDALFDEINALRNGTSSPQKARALSLLASHVIDSLRVQIQHGRLLLDGEKQKEVFLGSRYPSKEANERGDLGTHRESPT